MSPSSDTMSLQDNLKVLKGSGNIQSQQDKPIHKLRLQIKIGILQVIDSSRSVKIKYM